MPPYYKFVTFINKNDTDIKNIYQIYCYDKTSGRVGIVKAE